MVHAPNGILLSHAENEILHFAIRWMYLESIRLSEISEAEKDKCSDLTYIWNLKMKAKNTN